jgi:hypothetical protein
MAAMRRLLFVWSLFWGAALASACGPSDQEPLTPADRCALLCEPSASHPCAGEEVPSTCVSTCVPHIEGLVDDCLVCVMRNSGWIGQACECRTVDDFGNVNVRCDDCAYTSLERQCTDGTGTTCTKDSTSCSGFTLADPKGICVAACGG